MSSTSAASPEQAAHDNQAKNPAGGGGSRSSISKTSADLQQKTGSSDNENQQAVGGSSVPRRPRPVVHRAKNAHLLRRGQFVAFSNGPGQAQGAHGASIVIDPQTSYGVPITAQIELANALQPAGRATAMPPKRPSYLPARGEQAHHAHHRYPMQQLTTSLGATALTSSAAGKPNRYSWAQMQQWHAAQSAPGADLYGGPATAEASIERDGPVAAPSGPRAGFHYHFSSPFSSRVLLVPNPIMNLGEHTKSRLIKIIEALKRFSEQWFSHVLLLLFLASYACLGAYVFISFEAPSEQWEKQLIIETRLRIVNESYDQAHQLSSREEYVELFRTKFEDYERLLNRMCASGMSSSSLENQWTFWGALFYSMTVFTTIGYGHLTPITFAGRVATMIYAIFGIPILLMVLADLGKLLTRIIKYAFKKFRYWYNKLLGRKATVRTRQLISDHSNQYIGVAKNAFERGFATYIQPYQSRTASALRDAHTRVANLRRGNRAGLVQLDQAGNPILLLDQNGVPLGEQPAMQMQSSDVIVTPPKQTKPVSPKINDTNSSTSNNNNSKSHPLANQSLEGADLGTKAAAGSQNVSSSQQQATSKLSGEKRAQSPFNQSSKRKISATTSKHQSKSSSFSRSSSASNLATAGAASERPPKPASGTAKRSSLDQAAASQTGSGRESRIASESNLQSSDNVDSKQQEASQPNSQQEEIESDELVEEEEYDEMDEDLDIPVTFALFLLITYMMFGAVVFSIWESWNFFDALYFVFISMSTIGFGDLVPQHPKRMIGTFAYLLFGLALTSMCINVVQEKIHATFLRAKMQIGEKMGFDLEHIMADDYYDSNSAYGDEHEHMTSNHMDDDNGSCANSLAVSQSNSQTGPDQQHHHHHHHHHHQSPGHSASGPQAATSGDLKASSTSFDHQTPHAADTQQQHSAAAANASTTSAAAAAAAAAAASSQSGKANKNKDSLKWKKRSSGGGSTDQHSANSIKRKVSASSKKPARQTSPPAVASHLAAAPSNGAGPSTSPIRSQLETIRMFNLPVQSQVDDAKAGRPAAGPAPHINQPIAEGIRSFCEPLRKAFQSGSMSRSNSANKQHKQAAALAPIKTSNELRPTPVQVSNVTQNRSSLAASKSLDSSPISRHAALLNGSYRPAGDSTLGFRPPESVRNNTSPHQRHLHRSERSRTPKPLSRSLNSSRRASVSHELSQLDDLIVSLSGSPPERFGPLLGIPTQTSANRSAISSGSPINSSNNTGGSGTHIHRAQAYGSGALMVANKSNPSHRRGTSMMLRPATPSGDGRPQNWAGVQKKRSLVQSPSHQLLANELGNSNSELQTFYDQRRKSSSSYASTTSRAPIHSQELNLSESQAALDELEAVKYSAV